MSLRTLVHTHPAVREDIADLVTRRPVPGPGLDQVDPFLFLNHHGPQAYPPGNRGLPFGPHPHRGFETVTFILAGSLAHRDSAGHESVIHAGGVQWMTAGSGLVHAELSPEDFKRDGGPLEILQLWINLPGALKMSPPRYVGLQQADIPAVASADGRAVLHLAAGAWRGVAGPVHPLTGVFLGTLAMASGARAEFDGLADRSVFLYVVRGGIRIGDAGVPAHRLAQLSDAGDRLRIEATAEDTLVLLGHAAPLNEPVVSYGPFVMNTREQIQEAIRDYQAGKFDGISA